MFAMFNVDFVRDANRGIDSLKVRMRCGKMLTNVVELLKVVEVVGGRLVGWRGI